MDNTKVTDAGKKHLPPLRGSKARNKAAAEVMAKEKIPTDDPFALVADKPEAFSNEGVHLTAKGSAAVGEQVAREIRLLLGGDPT